VMWGSKSQLSRPLRRRVLARLCAFGGQCVFDQLEKADMVSSVGSRSCKLIHSIWVSMLHDPGAQQGRNCLRAYPAWDLRHAKARATVRAKVR
jgi:hypothetical protein